MMSVEARIQQFKQMVEADPNNELGHFSLGKACLEAGQYRDAITALERAIELNPRMSKAYLLLGESVKLDGQRDQAVEILTKGIEIADELGDRMPRDAMADMLRACGAVVPEFSNTQSESPTHQPVAGSTSAGFRCSRCGRPNNQLPKAPFKGKLGETIFANVCHGCWQEWIPMGTKVINELGLVLASDAGSQAYDQYMVEFLQLDNRV